MSEPNVRMMQSSLFPILKNTSATIIVRGMSGLVRIVLLLIIARKFGPVQFGQLSLALSFTEIFKVVADLGIDTIAIRRFAGGSEEKEKFLNNIVGLKVLLSTVSYLAAPVFFILIYRNVGGINFLFVTAISIYTTLLVNAFVSYFQAHLTMTKVIISNAIGSGVFVVLTLGGIVLNLPLVMIILAMPLAELITLILIAQLYQKHHQLNIEFDKAMAQTILRESLYVGISSIIVVTYLRLDTLMIGTYVGGKGVGEYSVAYRIVEPFLLLFSSLSLSLYASLSGSWNVESGSVNRRTIQRIVVPAGIFGLAAASILSFVVPKFITLISAEYVHAGEVLAVLGWSVVFKAINPQLTAILNSLGKFRIITIIAANNMLLSIILNMIFIPMYGILGAALTVVVVEGVNTLVQGLCISYTMKTVLKGSKR